MTITYLLRKEFLQIRRNAFIPRLIVLFPIMMMCVMPWVMNMEVKNVVVDVVDNDRSTMSSQLVYSIEASHYFVFGGQKASYADALDDIDRSKADIVVVIPRHFERDMTMGARPEMLVATNAVNGNKGIMGNAYISSIISQHLQGDVPTFASVLYLYNKNLNYKLFTIPSLMAIIILLVCGFLPALNIVGEKETGTIEAINVTPVRKWEFIIAKLIPYWVIALAVLVMCFVLAWAVYGITSAGSLALVSLLVMLLAFVVSGMGLVISNYNDTMQQAVFVMWFVIMCLLLLSGLFTPVRSMPQWAYLTTYVNPMHYFIDAIRTVFVRGGGFASVAHQVAALGAIATVMNVWAVMNYRKNS
jgi:ABC-2 type transport system permease protein